MDLEIVGENQLRAVLKGQDKIVPLPRGVHIGKIEVQLGVTDFFAGQGHALRGLRLMQYVHGNLTKPERPPKSGLPEHTRESRFGNT